MNNVVIIGRLVRDPELRFIPASGLAVAKFTLAVDREMSKEKKQEAANKGLPTADFPQVTVFGKLAENCANFLSKGRECAVLGKIQTGVYTDTNGTKRYTTDVIATRIEFIGGGGKNTGATNQSNTNESSTSANSVPAPAPAVDEEFDDVFFEGLNGEDGFDFDDEDIPF